jgi:hypothetical protein
MWHIERYEMLWWQYLMIAWFACLAKTPTCERSRRIERIFEKLRNLRLRSSTSRTRLRARIFPEFRSARRGCSIIFQQTPRLDPKTDPGYVVGRPSCATLMSAAATPRYRLLAAVKALQRAVTDVGAQSNWEITAWCNLLNP